MYNQQFDLDGFPMIPCTNERVETFLDTTALLQLITTLGSIQSAPSIASVPIAVIPAPVAVVQPALLKDCTLLTANQQSSLSKWLATDVKLKSPWKLSYQGSRDGFGSDKFHSLCDIKGESVTIIKSSDGFVFGGYSSASWDTQNKHRQWENAPDSFIFTISNPHGIQPTQYSLIQPQYAIYHHSGCGPRFGGGNDIGVSSDCNTNNKSFTNFPHSYEDTTGKGEETFTGSEYFIVSDIQVFTH